MNTLIDCLVITLCQSQLVERPQSNAWIMERLIGLRVFLLHGLRQLSPRSNNFIVDECWLWKRARAQIHLPTILPAVTVVSASATLADNASYTQTDIVCMELVGLHGGRT